jgi:hypothetical protein
MHLLAEELLKQVDTVVLNATYQPRKQREAIAALASKIHADVFLIQTRINAEVAKHRFLHRKPGHPAKDLTIERVVDLTNRYQYFDEGLVLDSDISTNGVPEPWLDLIRDHLENTQGIDCYRWISWSTSGPADVVSAAQERHAGQRLSPSRRRKERFKVGLFGLGILISLALAIPAGVSIVKTVRSAGFFNTNNDFARLALQAAVLLAGYFAILSYLRPKLATSWSIITAGNLPRYEPVHVGRPTDSDLYAVCCAKIPEHAEFLLISGTPLYFVVKPRAGRIFDVKLSAEGQSLDQAALSSRAAAYGLDWRGFRLWRTDDLVREHGRFPGMLWPLRWALQSRFGNSLGYIFGDCARVSTLTETENEVRLGVVPTYFADYFSNELSVDLKADLRLPDMRPFFEDEWRTGGTWDLSLAASGRSYSMAFGTAMLLITADGFLVLQRRSSHVSEGGGNVSASSSGFVNYRVDIGFARHLPFRLHKDRPADLKWAALRELREEIGVGNRRDEVKFVGFLGAAYNVLHGRDLNFYALATTKLDHAEISRRRLKAADRWEVASLVFLLADELSLSAGAQIEGRYAGLDSELNRHLRGALYCLSTSGFLKSWRGLV